MLHKRTQERMEWLLKKIAATHFNGMVAWDEDVVDDFVEAFPEAEKSLIYYMLGPNSSPMLNRAAGQAHKFGYLRAGSIGNMDARSFNKRTWCRYWSLTEKGKEYLNSLK
jgi:hypothetical protein